ncbi:MAG: queuosine precursor transporter [Firmicutes bacterium]|nr:queuosine precursor transporter [Bacillota bacterium]MCL1953939.1 queuosine precursor transporter [Bacillota bacterium]
MQRNDNYTIEEIVVKTPKSTIFTVQTYFVGLVALSVLFLVLLNIYALRPIGFGNIALNEFGIVFIAPVMVIQKIVVDVWGKNTAYKISLFALVCQIVVILLTLLALALPVDDARAEMAYNFKLVFESHWRIVLASILAFIVATLCNIYIFDKVKAYCQSRIKENIIFFLAAIISTLIAQLADDSTFNILAYAPIGLTSYEFDWRTVFMTLFVGAGLQILLEAFIVGSFAMHFSKRIKRKLVQNQIQMSSVFHKYDAMV